MFNDLDPILHSQLRLSIVSILMTVDEANFTFIQETTKAAAGNISIQIKKLQEAEYVKVKKTFINNYPNTSVSITSKGIKEDLGNLVTYIGKSLSVYHNNKVVLNNYLKLLNEVKIGGKEEVIKEINNLLKKLTPPVKEEEPQNAETQVQAQKSGVV